MEIYFFPNFSCINFSTLTLLFVVHLYFVKVVSTENIIVDLSHDSVFNKRNNEYCNFMFGLPPIPVDPLLGTEGNNDDLETWIPPPIIESHHHWILSGFSPDNVPIWIRQFINLDFEEVLTNNTVRRLYQKAQRQMWYKMIKSHKIKSTKGKPVNRHILITDFEGFNEHSASSVTDPRVVTLFRNVFAKGKRLIEKYVEKRIFINMNFLSELAVNAVNIINHRTFSKFQVYGTDKVLWTAQLRAQFGRHQLPEKYGGIKGHKPVPIYPQDETCSNSH